MNEFATTSSKLSAINNERERDEKQHDEGKGI